VLELPSEETVSDLWPLPESLVLSDGHSRELASKGATWPSALSLTTVEGKEAADSDSDNTDFFTKSCDGGSTLTLEPSSCSKESCWAY